jgi:hypothetical protein
MKVADEDTSMRDYHSNEWWEREIERKLADEEPENLHLDYKDKESLMPPGRGGGGIDKQKRAEDISKDVSSFINSDGGVLVYGVPEINDPNSTGGSPVPSGCNIGFQRGDIDKETIENLITSNIQPRPGPELFQVSEVPYGNDERLVFVVEVGVGNGDVWQAKDPLGVRKIKGIDVEDRFLSDGPTVASTQLCWNATTPGLAGKYAPLFKTEGPWPAATLNIGKAPTPRPLSGPIAYCFWRLQASNMQTKEGIVTVSLNSWGGLYLNDCEKHWEFG